MKTNKFTNVSDRELFDVSGGGPVGMVLGFVVGCVVGGIAGSIAYRDSIRSGSTPEMASKAFDTMFWSSVTCGVVIGAGAGV